MTTQREWSREGSPYTEKQITKYRTLVLDTSRKDVIPMTKLFLYSKTNLFSEYNEIIDYIENILMVKVINMMTTYLGLYRSSTLIQFL